MAKPKKAVVEQDITDPKVLKMISERVAGILAQSPNPVVIVGTKTELTQALSRLLAAQHALKAVEAAVDKEVHKILNAHAEQIAPLQAEITGIEKAIEQFALYHRDALLAEFGTEGGKTVSLVTGEITFRQNPPALRKRPNADENEAAEALIAEGYGDFVVKKLTPIKEAVRMQWETLEPVLNPFYTVTKGGESVLIRPTKTEV